MEKDVLLRELRHRVKNNLQVISSLLNLQSRQIAEPHVQDLFKESESRVRTIALAHENIYRAKDLGNIDIQDYLAALTTGLLRAFGRSSSVEVEVDAREAQLCVDVAILCGLIVNELVSNALKHAFPSGARRQGRGPPAPGRRRVGSPRGAGRWSGVPGVARFPGAPRRWGYSSSAA